MGPNGSGKSTLLLHLNGVLRSPTGKIAVAGLPVTDRNLGQIRAALHETRPGRPAFLAAAYGDVAFGPPHMNLPESQVRARAERALSAVGMADFAGRVSHHLSMGERKRIALATVLSMSRKFWCWTSLPPDSTRAAAA
ncbi:MAG: ATP-binding cassette domain-containing protein [Anaerolineae bacterium]